MTQSTSKKTSKAEKNTVKKTSSSEQKIPKKKHTALIIIIIAVAVLIVGLVIAGAIYFLNAKEWIFPPAAYSDDQQKVVKVFGAPEAFTITPKILEEGEEVTTEIWKYIEIDTIFTFQNGTFVERKYNDFGYEEGQDIFHLNLEPKDFYDIDSLSDLEDLLKTEPTAIAAIDKAVLDGTANYYDFDGWLNAAELDGQLVYIEQKAFIDGEKKTSVNQETLSDTEEFAQTDVPAPVTTIFTNKTSGFSFDAETYIEKIEEKKETADWAVASYGYYLVFPEVTDFPVFTIDVMNKSQYTENVTDSPMGDLYQLLGMEGGLYYLLSRPNGDLPEGSPDEAFFNVLKDTFKITTN